MKERVVAHLVDRRGKGRRLDIRDMLDELDAKALLGDFRGAPARDVEALVRAVVGLSDAYPMLRGRYSDIEINPIMLGAAGEGVYAVDIRAIARDDR
mgnify:CR=1 FL=1